MDGFLPHETKFISSILETCSLPTNALTVCVRSPAYSDITSSSQQDLEQSLSPELLSSRADHWQVSSPEGSRDGRSFSPPVGDTAAAASTALLSGITLPQDDQTFYRMVEIGKPEFVEKHRSFLHRKFLLGLYPTFNLEVPTDSDTPYTDVAKPRKRVRGGNNIKRPMNAFMAFAQGERQAFMAVRGTVDNSGISSHLGSVWKELADEVKDAFRKYASFLKDMHRMEFPDYKYRPQKRGKPDAGTNDTPSTTVTDPPTKKAKATKRSRGRKVKVEEDPQPVTVKVEPMAADRQHALVETMIRVGLLGQEQEQQQPRQVPVLSPGTPPPGAPAPGDTPQPSPFPEAEAAAAAEGQPRVEPLAGGLESALGNDLLFNIDDAFLDIECMKNLATPSFPLPLEPNDLDMNESFGPPGHNLVQGPEVFEALDTAPCVDFMLPGLTAGDV